MRRFEAFRHGLHKRRQARRRESVLFYFPEYGDGGVVLLAFIAPAKFLIQGFRQFQQPEKIIVGFAGPPHAGMFAVGRAVGGLKPPQVQGRAENLSTFQYHLADMLITVIARALLDVFVQYKNIHADEYAVWCDLDFCFF